MTLHAAPGRSDASTAQALLERLYGLPDGEKIKTCLQCGTCTGSCPVSPAMDYSPRAVFAALRAERLDRVLDSNTMWLCASCYACTVRCPAGIKITDVMYALKRLARSQGLARAGGKSAALSRSFVDTVDRTGRNGELEFFVRYFLRVPPVEARPVGSPELRMAPLGLRLFRKGRLSLKGEGVRDRAGFRKVMAQARLEDVRMEAGG